MSYALIVERKVATVLRNGNPIKALSGMPVDREAITELRGLVMLANKGIMVGPDKQAQDFCKHGYNGMCPHCSVGDNQHNPGTRHVIKFKGQEGNQG